MRCPTLAELPPPPEDKTGWPWTEETSQLPDVMPDGKPWPKISVVTPSFNQGQFLEETIRSVLLQGYPDLEYIIIDGGSTDESVDIIRKYGPWLRYWVSEPDDGQTAAINKGLKLINGDIAAYLNSDDVYCPGAFNKVINCFEINLDVAMLYGDVVTIDSEGGLLKKINVGEINIIMWLKHRFYIPQPAVFLRSFVFRDLGLFDEQFNLNMDGEYWTRILFHYPINYCPEIIAKVRIHKENKR